MLTKEAFQAAMADGEPATSERAMDAAEQHRLHIHRRFYDLTPEFHRGLGDMYLADPRFTKTYEDIRPGWRSTSATPSTRTPTAPRGASPDEAVAGRASHLVRGTAYRSVRARVSHGSAWARHTARCRGLWAFPARLGRVTQPEPS